jgi:hypothetical protein
MIYGSFNVFAVRYTLNMVLQYKSIKHYTVFFFIHKYSKTCNCCLLSLVKWFKKSEGEQHLGKRRIKRILKFVSEKYGLG